MNQNSDALEASIEAINENNANIGNSIESLEANTATLTATVDSLDVNTDTLMRHIETIDTNTGYIQESSGRLELNSAAIRINTESILESSMRLEENTSAVKDNTESILQSSDRIEGNTASVKDNTTGIIANTESIRENTRRLIDLAEAIGRGTVNPPDEPGQPDPAGPTVRITKGNPGPRQVGPGQGVACGENSPMCLLIDIELRNFSPGTYRVDCTHDGWANFGYEVWSRFDISVDATRMASRAGPCFLNFTRLYGNGVQLIVYRDGMEIARSNWLR